MRDIAKGPDNARIVALEDGDLTALLEVSEGLFDHPIIVAEAKHFLADPANLFVAIYLNDAMVSFVSATVLRHPDKPKSLFVNEVGTHEDFQRRGFAAAGVRAMLHEARSIGCKGIWLGTEADNAPARALYRSLHAEEVDGVYYGWDDAF